MTQQLVATQAPPPEPVDNLKKMLADIELDRHRIKTKPPADVAGLVREIIDTVLVYQKDIISELVAHRDWTSSVVADVDGRIEELETQAEGGGTQFLPEDAEKFKALAQGVDFIILTMSSIPGVKMEGEMAAQLGKLKDLAQECLVIIEDSTLEDDEEEDGEDEPSGGAPPG